MRKTELLSQQELRWWFQILFLPLSREIIQLLTDVFLIGGRNHQLEQQMPTRYTTYHLSIPILEYLPTKNTHI